MPATGCPPPPPTETAPPTLGTSYNCLADGPATGVLSPSSGNWTASGDLDLSPFGVKIDVTAKPGFIFVGGQSMISLTATASEDNSCEVTPVQSLRSTPHPEVWGRRHVHDSADARALSVPRRRRGHVAAGTYDLPARHHPSPSRRQAAPGYQA